MPLLAFYPMPGTPVYGRTYNECRTPAGYGLITFFAKLG